MRIADVFAGFGLKFIPRKNVLGFFDMIFAAFGKFINNTYDKIH